MDNSLDGLDVSAGSCAGGGAALAARRRCSAAGARQPRLPAVVAHVRAVCKQRCPRRKERVSEGRDRPELRGERGRDKAGVAEPSAALPPASQPA